MEDDESGSSSFNTSDGGSGSWSPSPSQKNNNQHVRNREGGYGRMESKQLLSNEFYTRQFSRPRAEQSDEEDLDESDEDGDELEQQQGHAGVEGEEEGSEGDSDGLCEETQLLQQYNAAHYSKVDHEEKLRCRGPFDSPLATENNNILRFGGTQVYQETQLLDNYDLGCYGIAQQETGKPMHTPLVDHSKELQILHHERVDSDAETADEAEPTETVDLDGGTDDDAATSSQDQQEVPLKGKSNSDFRQERMCEFDMDLNVTLEEEMDCEFYGEPMNQNTQLIPNTETQLVNPYPSWQGDTQLISTPGKEFLCNIPSSHVATDARETPCETIAGVDSYNSRGNAMQHGGPKPSSSSLVELPSVTTESKLLAIPSASEASEGSPFQSCVGTIHAESIRIAAMQPITWHPKLKPDDHIFQTSQTLPISESRRDTGKSVYRHEPPSNDPEWMRDYGSRGDSSQGKKNQEDRAGAPGSSSGQEFSFPKASNSKAPGTLTNGLIDVAEQGTISPQALISGMRTLFGTSYTPGASYNSISGTPRAENRLSQLKTTLPPRSPFGPRLPSPTSSLNYLDSLEPGEEVQAQALDMVDKLVWLNTADAAPASPPRTYKKSFPGLPPATPTPMNPALQVFEFEDTPSLKRPQAHTDMSLIKEIQDGWKKKAEQNLLAQTVRKGKDNGTGLLPEGERLSKLLTENDLSKICEPRAAHDVASSKRLSAKLQGKGEACLDNATTKNSGDRVPNAKGDHAPTETERPRGSLVEPAPLEVADDDLLNVVASGLRRRSVSRGMKAEELVERAEDHGEKEGKAPYGTTQILTRRRSQGTRNRREYIRVPVVISGNHLSPERAMLMDCEMQKNLSTSRKRRSLNVMLRDRSAKKAKSTVEDKDEEEDEEEDQNGAYEDQNEVHEDMDVLSSPRSSDADPMFIVPDKTSNRRRKGMADNADNKDEGKASLDTELPPARRKKRMRLTEATKLVGADVMGDMPTEADGVNTRSLRQLRRRGNTDEPVSSGPTIPQVVQKRLRSARRGSGGVQGAPKISMNEDDECDPGNDIEQDVSTSTWSATFQGDSNNDGVDANDGSSPEQSEDENENENEHEDEDKETLDQRGSHIDVSVEDGDVLGRLRMARTRSIADVSSPSTPVLLQPAPFPLVTGRRGRGASVKPEIMEEANNNLQLPHPAFVAPPAGKGFRMRTVRKRRDPQMLPALASEGNATEFNPEGSASVSTEGSLRARRGTNVSVLFSHGLSEDTVKKQRKIVERLDGKVTRKAADCTHFVAEKFVRTGNMLEAMAAGKFVVTFAWLESCQMANCFIDERNFLLQDEKKERELGFSMRSTLFAAQRKPLLQGIRVLLTPNISPKSQAIAAIVQAAGGQVVEEYEGPAPDTQDEDFCIVIANEDDLEICAPLLDQGAKVYNAELILSGVICHHLDFSKHLLFENYRVGRRRGATLRQ